MQKIEGYLLDPILMSAQPSNSDFCLPANKPPCIHSFLQSSANLIQLYETRHQTINLFLSKVSVPVLSTFSTNNFTFTRSDQVQYFI